MRKKLLIAGWILGILFPMAWFSQSNAVWNAWFNRIFAPTWMHVAMHALLYAVLAAFLAGWQRRGQPWLPLAVVLLVGLAQETLQSLPAGVFSGAAALFDLGVDLFGGLLGVGMVQLARNEKQERFK